MNNITICLLFLFFGILNLKAQDPVFSQFHRSGIYLNPAFTGINGGFTVTGVLREQWGRIVGNSPFPGVFSTQYGSVEWASSSNKSGLSAFFMNDVEGDASLRTEYGGINYCYVIPWEKWHGLNNLRIGFGLYYSKKTIEWDKLLFSDQLHPKGKEYFLPFSSHAEYYDFFRANPPWWTGLNFGLLYRYSERQGAGNGKEISVGFAVTHMLNLLSSSSVESLQGIDTGLEPKFTLHGSLFFPLLQIGSKGNRFTPIFNGRIEYQGGISAFTIGGDMLYKNVGLGVYYQNTFANTFWGSTDALIIAFDMEVPFGKNDQSIELGFSYDINMNGLASYTGGVFEFVVKYRINRFLNKVICPKTSRAAHQERWENIFYKNQKNKNLN